MTADPRQHPVLEARSMVKRFPGVLALDRVDLQIDAGEVHGLIGENGAGKSTLMHILAGVQQPDEGKMLLDGQCVQFANPREALDRGISIVYQELNLIPYLTVAENIFLGRELQSATGLIDSKEQNRRCTALLAQLDPTIDPRVEVNSLRVGQQQIVEVAKALNCRARVIFMDEPTSAISDQEIEVLFRLIESLKRDGIAIVYVSHKLDELLSITDRITVLRDGRLVKTLPTRETNHDAIVRLMVGRQLNEMFVHTETKPQGKRLRVSDLSQKSATSNFLRVDGVSFSVEAGEVLGIFGLMGAGRTELLESVFGLRPKQTTGTVFVDGQQCAIRCPSDAMRYGIGLVPEDRKHDGLVLEMSVEQNISLASLKQMERGLLLSSRVERAHAERYVGRFAIRTPSVRQDGAKSQWRESAEGRACQGVEFPTSRAAARRTNPRHRRQRQTRNLRSDRRTEAAGPGDCGCEFRVARTPGNCRSNHGDVRRPQDGGIRPERGERGSHHAGRRSRSH